MEPKGGGALAIGPSLVAIITVMIRADKTQTVIQSGAAEVTLTDKTDANIPEAPFGKIQF